MSSEQPLALLLIRPRNPGPVYVEDYEDEDSCNSYYDDDLLLLSDDDEDRIMLAVNNSNSFDLRSDVSFVDMDSSSSDKEQCCAKDRPSTPPVRIVKPVPVRVTWRTQVPHQHQKPQDSDCCDYDCYDDDVWSGSENSPTYNNDISRSRSSRIPRALFPSSTTALETARDGLLLALSAAGGNTDGHAFRQCLTTLHEHYQRSGLDVRFHSAISQGTWLTLTKPVFKDCLGETDHGDPLYTLGRMSFDMFCPARLICSLQGNFNCVEATTLIPDVLQDVIQPVDHPSFCTYNGLCAFTVEANHYHPHHSTTYNDTNPSVDRPCRGILTTNGYMCADRNTPNRHTVWITSGAMHANDTAEDVERWNALFAKCHNSSNSMGGLARQLASRFLTGAVNAQKNNSNSSNYTQSYAFRRALGGHGMAYVDTLYLDPSLRIVRGHRGTLFVFSKLKAAVQD